MNTATLCSVIVVTLFAFTSLEAVTGPDTRIINMLCNNAQFTEGSPFADALKIIWNYTTGYYGAYPFLAKSCETSFFLEADCRQGLGGDGCNNCFRVIQHDINVMCTYNMGVQATLPDCKLRYETYSFNQINEKLPTCTLGDAFVLSEDLK